MQRDPQALVSRLSYSHIEQLVDLEDQLERAFYELESVNGGWSVRELKRQIGALYFQRSGLSKDLPNQIFVSKYQLELPSREQIQEFIDAQIREAGHD